MSLPHTLQCLVTVLYGELNETYGPYEKCLQFVTVFTVRTDFEALCAILAPGDR